MTQGRLMQFSTRWASIAIFVLIAIGAAHAQGALVAIDLGPQAGSPPERENDWQNAVRIDRFILANGNSDHIQTTPTSVSLQWDEAALYVHFVCADPDPFYRDGVRLRRSDRVEVGLLPPGARQSELWQFSVDETGDAFVTHRSYKTTLQGAKVSAVGGVWTAALTIVWPPFGGVPSKPFMLQLARVRSITGEVLSPSAVDFHDGPVTTEFAPAAADEFIEVNLGGTKGIRTADFGLITLPSGTRRWERRAVLHKATGGELKEIMGLQQELDTQPTSETNLADRVRLAEIWYDLLDQEGFSFNAESETWLPGKGELDPWTARHEFNDSLRSGDSAAAGRVLDSLLQHFNRVSKTWFADGTPGDAHEDSWAEIDAIDSVTATSNEMVLHARAAQRSFDLVLSFPSSGGLRLHGPDAGFFTPDALSPMEVKRTENEVRATANHLTVEIGLKADWHLDILSANYPQPIWNLRRGDLRIHPDSRGQVAAVEMRGRLSPPEGIFGMGERFDSFNQRGRTLTLWQLDAWDSLVHGGLENQAYKPIPLWHSTAGYSVFWNSSYQIRADFGNARQDEYRIVAHGPNLDLYVWSGDSQTALRGYSSLTGKPLLPPVWAFEPWMGGGGDRWGKDVGKTPAQAILAVVDKFHQLDIPHSSVYAEGEASDDPLLYQTLGPLNIRVLMWGRSEPLGWSFDQIGKALPDVPTSRLPLMRLNDGTVYGFPESHILSEQFPYYDFTDPRGVDLLRAYWKRSFDLGVAGTMVDFGDIVPRNALFHDGTTGEQMHNWYAHLYHKYVHQVFEERRGDDHVLFSRGASAGSQVDVSQMAGDHESNFRGLDESIAGGLSISASGFSNWGVDVGGYKGKPDEEVYLRWVEFGAFSPLMRFHGTEPREPWCYSDAAVAIYKKYAWLRENLLPYIYGSAQDTHADGLPLMRPMSALATDEYMFGDDLLVAPVHAPGEHRTIHIPDGHWTDLWTGLHVGEGTHDAHVPMDEIPVFLRAGALIPIGVAPDFTLGESMTAGRVQALVITQPDKEGTTHAWKLPGREGVTRIEAAPEKFGLRVTVDDWPDLRFLLLSGFEVEIKSIMVNGQSLPALEGLQAQTLPPGWKRIDRGRIAVRLPAALNQVIDIAVQ